MALPNRNTHALPQHAGSHALARSSGANATRYKDAARQVGGEARAVAKRTTTSAAAHGSRARAAASGALARAAGKPDSLGGIFARSLTPGLTVGVLGAIDGSALGRKFSAWSGGIIEPSTALSLLGGLGRATDWDRKFLGKHVERMNVSMLTGMFPVALYKLGRWTPDALARGIKGGDAKANGAAIQVEVVPGEATTA